MHISECSIRVEQMDSDGPSFGVVLGSIPIWGICLDWTHYGNHAYKYNYKTELKTVLQFEAALPCPKIFVGVLCFSDYVYLFWNDQNK